MCRIGINITNNIQKIDHRKIHLTILLVFLLTNWHIGRANIVSKFNSTFVLLFVKWILPGYLPQLFPCLPRFRYLHNHFQFSEQPMSSNSSYPFRCRVGFSGEVATVRWVQKLIKAMHILRRADPGRVWWCTWTAPAPREICVTSTGRTNPPWKGILTLPAALSGLSRLRSGARWRHHRPAGCWHDDLATELATVGNPQ
jgi:hypothetical protein